MRLTKKEKELILFMGGSSIGTVSINEGTPDQKTMLKLDGRGLVKFHQPLLPFLTYGINYWSLSAKGWEMLDTLKKEANEKEVKSKEVKQKVKQKVKRKKG